MVWEDEGPRPMEYKSKSEMTACSVGGGASSEAALSDGGGAFVLLGK